MTLFDEGSERLFGDPFGVRMIAVPAAQDSQNDFRMIAADVIEMICDGLADVESGVGLEIFEDGEGWGGVGDQFV